MNVVKIVNIKMDYKSVTKPNSELNNFILTLASTACQQSLNRELLARVSSPEPKQQSLAETAVRQKTITFWTVMSRRGLCRKNRRVI